MIDLTWWTYKIDPFLSPNRCLPVPFYWQVLPKVGYLKYFHPGVNFVFWILQLKTKAHIHPSFLQWSLSTEIWMILCIFSICSLQVYWSAIEKVKKNNISRLLNTCSAIIQIDNLYKGWHSPLYFRSLRHNLWAKSATEEDKSSASFLFSPFTVFFKDCCLFFSCWN